MHVLAETVNQTDPSHSTNPAGALWQSVGEIMLPIHLNDGGTVHVSLQQMLAPLQLPADLIHRIAKSIQDILERPAIKEIGGHAHLFIFVPTKYKARVGSWGFFCIERDEAEGGNARYTRAVNLYLYPEGR